jgi:SAM-dependent methyltransferase
LIERAHNNYWDSDYSWERGGEEWSDDWGDSRHQWSTTIFPRISGHFPVHTIVEIAPGYGRWSEYLLEHCREIFLVDLSPKCIEACKKRFSGKPSVHSYCNDGTTLPMLDSDSTDFVFSFDSLVHADIHTISSYLREIRRILKEGGAAFLHHSNLADCKPSAGGKIKTHQRDASVSAQAVRNIVRDARGVHLVSQELIPWGHENKYLTDCFTIIEKSAASDPLQPQVINNFDFMKEASLSRQRFIDSVSPFHDADGDLSEKPQNEKT